MAEAAKAMNAGEAQLEASIAAVQKALNFIRWERDDYRLELGFSMSIDMHTKDAVQLVLDCQENGILWKVMQEHAEQMRRKLHDNTFFLRAGDDCFEVCEGVASPSASTSTSKPASDRGVAGARKKGGKVAAASKTTSTRAGKSERADVRGELQHPKKTKEGGGGGVRGIRTQGAGVGTGRAQRRRQEQVLGGEARPLGRPQGETQQLGGMRVRGRGGEQGQRDRAAAQGVEARVGHRGGTEPRRRQEQVPKKEDSRVRGAVQPVAPGRARLQAGADGLAARSRTRPRGEAQHGLAGHRGEVQSQAPRHAGKEAEAARERHTGATRGAEARRNVVRIRGGEGDAKKTTGQAAAARVAKGQEGGSSRAQARRQDGSSMVDDAAPRAAAAGDGGPLHASSGSIVGLSQGSGSVSRAAQGTQAPVQQAGGVAREDASLEAGEGAGSCRGGFALLPDTASAEAAVVVDDGDVERNLDALPLDVFVSASGSLINAGKQDGNGHGADARAARRDARAARRAFQAWLARQQGPALRVRRRGPQLQDSEEESDEEDGGNSRPHDDVFLEIFGRRYPTLVFEPPGSDKCVLPPGFSSFWLSEEGEGGEGTGAAAHVGACDLPRSLSLWRSRAQGGSGDLPRSLSLWTSHAQGGTGAGGACDLPRSLSLWSSRRQGGAGAGEEDEEVGTGEAWLLGRQLRADQETVGGTDCGTGWDDLDACDRVSANAEEVLPCNLPLDLGLWTSGLRPVRTGRSSSTSNGDDKAVPLEGDGPGGAGAGDKDVPLQGDGEQLFDGGGTGWKFKIVLHGEGPRRTSKLSKREDEDKSGADGGGVFSKLLTSSQAGSLPPLPYTPSTPESWPADCPRVSWIPQPGDWCWRQWHLLRDPLSWGAFAREREAADSPPFSDSAAAPPSSPSTVSARSCLHSRLDEAAAAVTQHLDAPQAKTSVASKVAAAAPADKDSSTGGAARRGGRKAPASNGKLRPNEKAKKRAPWR